MLGILCFGIRAACFPQKRFGCSFSSCFLKYIPSPLEGMLLTVSFINTWESNLLEVILRSTPSVGTLLTSILRATHFELNRLGAAPNCTYNHPRRYAVEYLTSNWEKLRDFNEAFSGVDLEKMREEVQPLLVAEGQSDALPLLWWSLGSMCSYALNLSVPCALVQSMLDGSRFLVLP